MTESELRDVIANRIEVLGSGLALFEKEHYIPSTLGTRSFIDLYARDSDGHHVLIELKRTAATSREAIHEVYKYVEAVKSHLGARDNEIRVIIAAVDWRELLVPYSRFVADTHLAVTGLHLRVDETSMTVVSEPVSPLPMERGRVLAPWYEVYWYSDRDALEKGLESIRLSCRQKRISDYVTVVLQPPEPIPSEHQLQMRNSIRMMGALAGFETVEVPEAKYEYAVCFATQQLTMEAYLERLGPDYESAAELDPDTEPDDLLRELHEELLAREPLPFSEHLEIGYGAKLSKFLNAYGCEVESVNRVGIFERNHLLTDADIISELEGDDGGTGQRLKRIVLLSNRAHVNALKDDVNRCLEENEVWRSQIHRVLDEIEATYPNSELEVSIFYPGTGAITLYFAATKECWPLYIPMYSVLVRNPEPFIMYFGCLQQESGCDPFSFRQILDAYYEGEVGNLVMALSWGGREPRDVDVLEDLGLMYKTFRVKIADDQRSFYVLRDDRWRACGPVNPYAPFADFMDTYQQLMNEVALKIGARANGGGFDASLAQYLLNSQTDLQRAESEPLLFSGAPSQCDVCGCNLSDEPYMVDGRIRDESFAACMCGECSYCFGEGIGWGKGQLYTRTDKGWLLVGGFGPRTDDDEAD